jgi:HK97 family phage major capsid protein
MTPEEKATAEKAALIAEIKEASEKGAEAKINAFKASPEFQELVSKAAEAKTAEAVADVKKKFDELSASIESKLEAGQKTAKGLSVKEQIEKGLTGQKEALANMARSQKESANFSLSLKSAGTFTTGNIDAVGTNGISILLADIEAGITATPSARPNLIQYFNRGTMTGSYVVYAEMKNNDGGAGMTAEGNTKTQMDFDIVEAKSDAKKITSYIKTSKEALSDIAGLNAEINGELMVLLMNKLEDQVLDGNGTGAELAGLTDTTNVSTAYSAGNFANTIADANIYDVINTAASQIMTAEVISGRPAGFMPNIVILNPEDIIKLKLTKDTNGQYLFPVSLPGTPNIAGLTVVSSPWLAADKFIVADGTKINFRVREDVNINIGYENDDFTKNLVTILAEARVAMYVKSNYKKAIVYGDITDAIVALDPAT